MALPTWIICDEVSSACRLSSTSRQNPRWCGGSCVEVTRSGGVSVLSGASSWFTGLVTRSDWFVLSAEVLAVLEEEVSS